MAAYTIAPARTPDDLAAAIALLRDYAASLDVDLAYQNFEAELVAMPGQYGPPAGALLLARAADGAGLGCVAIRPMGGAGLCEMKRLYVAPTGRGLGLGRALVRAAAEAARHIGYGEIRLDTLPSMEAAIALYRASNFEEIAPYYLTPIAGTMFMRLRL